LLVARDLQLERERSIHVGFFADAGRRARWDLSGVDLIADYAATGLPPAYLPTADKDDRACARAASR